MGQDRRSTGIPSSRAVHHHLHGQTVEERRQPPGSRIGIGAREQSLVVASTDLVGENVLPAHIEGATGRAHLGLAQRLGPRIDPEGPAVRVALRRIQGKDPAYAVHGIRGLGHDVIEAGQIAGTRVMQRLGEQLLLGPEVIEDQRRAAVERGSHIRDTRTRETAAGHFRLRCGEDLLAPHLHLAPGHGPDPTVPWISTGRGTMSR